MRAPRRTRWTPPTGRWTAEDGRAALTAWRASGLSRRAFASACGFDAQRLWWWERRLETAGRREVTTISLLPVTVATAPAAIAPPSAETAPRVIVRVPGSVTVEIEGATPAWAGELIAALARSS
ncbi:MAG: hypothetical protein HS111_11265 [Kofleriaceae bacterium]|nr:hypothetical protein [Kofleriaceae bacterium]